MKLHNLYCPYCSEVIDIKVEDTIDFIFCPYCGNAFLINSAEEVSCNKNININKNINVHKDIHTHTTDDAQILREKLRHEENKSDNRTLLIIIIVLICSAFALLASSLIPMYKAKHEGKISAGYYKDLIGENYKTVEAHFDSAGFKNIELIDLDDSRVAIWKNDKVKKISVGGNTDFDSDDYFDPNTKVVISYH